MAFQKKKIRTYDDNGQLTEYSLDKGSRGRKIIIALITIVVCFGVAAFVWSIVKPYVQNSINRVGRGAVTVISKTVGQEPQTDDKGHVNALILGFGGEQHAGGYLSDSIMIASFNPKRGGVTLLSIPRDLYIAKTLGGYGKINGDFASLYYAYEKDFMAAGSGFAAKIQEITGVPIQYYFMIDFAGFEQLIDKLGGINIDVPYNIYDTTYPGPNNSYQTFAITMGMQNMSGSTALKYARSRHTTSDFARSLRQQQILKAVMEKIFSFDNVTTPGKIKSLYADFNTVVHTNMTLDEIIGSMQYAYKIKKFSSFQYSVCNSYRRETTVPGCLLFNPPLAAFNASVELPLEATPTNVSEYKVLRSFAEQVVYNDGYLVEDASIRILNGLDTGHTRMLTERSIASSTAMHFMKMGIRVFDVGNNPAPYEQTTLLVNGTGDYTDTINQMKKILSIPVVTTGTYTPDGPTLTLVLGNDYVTSPKPERPLYLNY